MMTLHHSPDGDSRGRTLWRRARPRIDPVLQKRTCMQMHFSACTTPALRDDGAGIVAATVSAPSAGILQLDHYPEGHTDTCPVIYRATCIGMHVRFCKTAAICWDSVFAELRAEAPRPVRDRRVSVPFSVVASPWARQAARRPMCCTRFSNAFGAQARRRQITVRPRVSCRDSKVLQAYPHGAHTHPVVDSCRRVISRRSPVSRSE